MKTVGTLALIIIGAMVAWWVGGIVVGIVSLVLHWAVILAIVGGVGYVAYSLANPGKSLGGRTRILP